MTSLPILIQLLAAVAVASGAVLLALRMTQAHPVNKFSNARGSIAYLFDGDRLIHATHPALDLLRIAPAQKCDIDRLVSVFAKRFPSLTKSLAQIADLGTTQLRPNDGGLCTLELRYVDGMTRVTLHTDETQPAQFVSEEIKTQTLKDELAMLRSIVDDSDQLMWREGVQGDIVWANAAYIEMSERVHGESKKWPPAKLFAELDNGELSDRQAILPKGDHDLVWFDLRVKEVGLGRFFTAHDVSAVIRADDIQQDVMQTLARTFAGLALGVAVFDRKRQLIMFNPSLSDMAGLKVTDLIARPQIETFLDMLRETRLFPEPRDYGQWRRQLSELEAEALSGDYVEIWPLADGRTFRITGRPFPSGSIALFFEDISEGVSKTREMHTALRLCQDALDGVRNAVAVFAPNGGPMMLSNTEFNRLWGDLNGAGDQDSNLDTFCSRWREVMDNPDEWDAVCKASHRTAGPMITFVTSETANQSFSVTVRNLSDGSVSVMFEPATDGLSEPSIARACG